MNHGRWLEIHESKYGHGMTRLSITETLASCKHQSDNVCERCEYNWPTIIQWLEPSATEPKDPLRHQMETRLLYKPRAVI